MGEARHGFDGREIARSAECADSVDEASNPLRDSSHYEVPFLIAINLIHVLS